MKQESQAGLIPALGLGALIVYGVGDILGAGIYTLIGKIAGHAGVLTWLSFAIAMAIVLFTALSYGELASRLPKSGGVSIYIQEAFGREGLSILVGFFLFSATMLSMSTVSQAFVGYLAALGVKVPKWMGVFGFFSVLMLINVRGIKQSSISNMISTAIEISGLLIVLICGFWYFSKTNFQPPALSSKPLGIVDVLQGTALAFFAFTGFEDLVNVAEEAKKPRKNLPRAILYSLGVAGVLYLSVSWVSTAIISGSELSQSDSPLLQVVLTAYPAMPIYLFSIIAIFAVANTALLNYITASRLLYGMAEANLLPKLFQSVHSKYHTPYVAILLIFPIVFGLGLTGTLKELASSTSAIVLTIFSFSCIALIKIKWRERHQKANLPPFRVPIWVPCLGVVLNLTAISFLPFSSLISAIIFIGVGSLLIFSYRLMSRNR